MLPLPLMILGGVLALTVYLLRDKPIPAKKNHKRRKADNGDETVQAVHSGDNRGTDREPRAAGTAVDRDGDVNHVPARVEPTIVGNGNRPEPTDNRGGEPDASKGSGEAKRVNPKKPKGKPNEIDAPQRDDGGGGDNVGDGGGKPDAADQ